MTAVLRSMSALEARDYLRDSLADYAADRARADRVPLAEALSFATSQRAMLLPRGTETPGHHFFCVVTGRDAQVVGALWLFTDSARSTAFVYDIVVHPPHRRRGYGRDAMRAAMDFAERLGCRQIALNVFGFNTPAQALYQGLGFEAASHYMTRLL